MDRADVTVVCCYNDPKQYKKLAEDLARRDLTVNAMAMDVRGDITDLYGGRDDLRRSRSPAPRRRPRSVRLCHARRAFRPRP